MAAVGIDLHECIDCFVQRDLVHEDTIKEICKRFRAALLHEENVVTVNHPVTVVGALHGQFDDLLNVFAIAGAIPFTNYLFLGNYLNYGSNGLELFCTLMCYKILYPTKVTLLRGMAELPQFCEQYGFRAECFRKYGNYRVYDMVAETFGYLPLFADVHGKYLCTGGGILPRVTLSNIKELDRLKAPTTQDVLLWLLVAQPSDKSYLEHFKPFERDEEFARFTFSFADVEEFLKADSAERKTPYQLLITTNSLQPIGDVRPPPLTRRSRRPTAAAGPFGARRTSLASSGTSAASSSSTPRRRPPRCTSRRRPPP